MSVQALILAADEIVHVLSDEEGWELIDTFVGMNPHWDGAHVPDIIDWLNEHDSHLEIVEPMYEYLAPRTSEEWRGHIGACTRAVALIHKCRSHPAALPYVIDLMESLAQRRAVIDLWPDGRPL